MEAIILAGGLGTRLRSVVSDMPKPMAPIGNKPFLEYIFHYLIKNSVNRAILSTGYRHDIIEAHFGTDFNGVNIKYSVEDEPLGTGGAIKKALQQSQDKKTFIINGDTYFNVDLNKLLETHQMLNADITIALKPMDTADRYGTVVIENNRIISFKEKESNSSGYINGGVYCISSALFKDYLLAEKFSFESDFLSKYIPKLKVAPFIADDYFIDIGIPEDYYKAQQELEKLV